MQLVFFLSTLASINVLVSYRGKWRGLVDLEGSSSQLWALFLFTRPCNNRCSQGEVIKNTVKASQLLLSPLCPFSCQRKYRQ